MSTNDIKFDGLSPLRVGIGNDVAERINNATGNKSIIPTGIKPSYTEQVRYGGGSPPSASLERSLSTVQHERSLEERVASLGADSMFASNQLIIEDEAGGEGAPPWQSYVADILSEQESYAALGEKPPAYNDAGKNDFNNIG